MTRVSGVDPRLPALYRVVAAARQALRGPGTRMVYGSPIARSLRRALSSAAPNEPRLVTVCGGRLKGSRLLVDLSCEKYYWLGTHEEAVQAWVARHVRAGDVVYDIGAHIGFFALLFSRLAGPTGHVCAFEPLPENFSRLAANVEVNRTNSVEIHRLALSDYEGSATFAVAASSLMGHLSGETTVSADAIQVQTRTVDGFVAGGGKIPDLLKVDVEGAEADVIRGAAATIASRPPRMLVEIHSDAAAWALVEALPVSYVFWDIATGKATRPPLAPGHYFLRPANA